MEFKIKITTAQKLEEIISLRTLFILQPSEKNIRPLVYKNFSNFARHTTFGIMFFINPKFLSHSRYEDMLYMLL